MTENEAIKLGKDLYENITVKANNIIPTKKYIDFVEIAIQALEEIQQYRAIGTVDEIIHSNAKALVEQVELEKYKAIGTIEEFKALKEKNEPKKPILNNPKINEFYIKEAKLCPACHSYINNYSGDYCRDCGQKLDWSE